MPRGVEPMLGDDLLDAYRVFVTEVYDSLAADGFPDLPQAATTVFRDIDGAGSLVSDLAAQGGMTPAMMWAVVRELEAGGYVEIDGETVRPAARGHEAYAAGRKALADAEERWGARIGADRVATLREILHELVSYGPGL